MMFELALSIVGLIFLAAVALVLKALIPSAMVSISDIFDRERG
jgi:hypothetical protein